MVEQLRGAGNHVGDRHAEHGQKQSKVAPGQLVLNKELLLSQNQKQHLTNVSTLQSPYVVSGQPMTSDTRSRESTSKSKQSSLTSTIIKSTKRNSSNSFDRSQKTNTSVDTVDKANANSINFDNLKMPSNGKQSINIKKIKVLKQSGAQHVYLQNPAAARVQKQAADG
jgi:hypothetical protein